MKKNISLLLKISLLTFLLFACLPVLAQSKPVKVNLQATLERTGQVPDTSKLRAGDVVKWVAIVENENSFDIKNAKLSFPIQNSFKFKLFNFSNVNEVFLDSFKILPTTGVKKGKTLKVFFNLGAGEVKEITFYTIHQQ